MKKKCFGVGVVIVFFVLMIYAVFCRHKINMIQNENNELQAKIASIQIDDTIYLLYFHLMVVITKISQEILNFMQI